MNKLHPNGAWGTSPDKNDHAMDLYEQHVVQVVQQSLLDMFESADAEREFRPDADTVWSRIGVLAELKEEAPGLWRHIFDPSIDDDEGQAILSFAFDDLTWLRHQQDWLDQWDNPGAVKRAITRCEKTFVEWMSIRTLGAGKHRG